MDIDHFKLITGPYRLDSGDLNYLTTTVLVEIAQVFRRCIRQGDVIGRWGGEEFMLPCAGLDSATGLRRAEEIREQIAQHLFNRANSPPQGNPEPAHRLG